MQGMVKGDLVHVFKLHSRRNAPGQPRYLKWTMRK